MDGWNYEMNEWMVDWINSEIPASQKYLARTHRGGWLIVYQEYDTVRYIACDYKMVKGMKQKQIRYDMMWMNSNRSKHKCLPGAWNKNATLQAWQSLTLLYTLKLAYHVDQTAADKIRDDIQRNLIYAYQWAWKNTTITGRITILHATHCRLDSWLEATEPGPTACRDEFRWKRNRELHRES